MPLRTSAEIAVDKAKNDSGLWLLRVENEKNETLFRASANYASKGFDETLYRKKQNQKLRHPGTASSNASKTEFENTAFGLIPTRYNNFETGRSLTTELPRDRPTSGRRAPPTAGPELKYAKAKLEEKKRNYKETLRHEEAAINKALGVKTSKKDEDLKSTYQQLENGQTDPIFENNANHMATSIDPSRLPLSKLQGLTYYDVGRQPVKQEGFTDAEVAKLASGLKLNKTEIDSHQQLPKASSVLRRYQIFSTRTDANSAGENVVEMMHGKPAEEMLPGSKGPQPLPRATAGQAVMEGRKMLNNSHSFVQLGPQDYSRNPKDSSNTEGSLSGATSRPPPGLSQAILQNRLGSTAGLSNGVQIPRGGSGLVVGDLQITHNQIAPSTLIAAKWGRVSSTTYAKTPDEPCRLRCEMQPVYYESFIRDLDYSLGEGSYVFSADVSPTVFLVDIGSANEALHGHRGPNQPPTPIGHGRTLAQNASFQQQQQQQQQLLQADVFNLEIPGTADSSAGEASEPEPEASPTRSGLAIMDIARSGKKGAIDDISASKMRLEKRNKGKKNKKKKHISEDEVRRGELRFAMDVGKAKANDLLLGLADNGNDYGIQKLFRIGYKIDYNPNPWYVQLAMKQKESREKAMRGLQVGAGENEEGGKEDGNEGDGSLPRGLQEDYKPKETDVFVLPDVNVTDAEGNTPLMRAARHGFIDAVVCLLREGADYRRKNGRGQTAYDLAKAESNTASIALQMQVPGANERKRRAAKLCQLLDDRTVLVCAQKGDIRRMKFLVENDGHPVDAVNDYGMTPMHFAVIRKDVEMITYLSEKGASITARNNLGQTPLSIALDTADINQEKILRALNSGDAIRAYNAQRDEAEYRAQKQMLSDEKKLVSELKTFTRGTTAAKAVQAAFPMGTTRLPPFGPPDSADPNAIPVKYHPKQMTSLTALTESRPSTSKSLHSTSNSSGRISALSTLRKSKTELLNEGGGGLVESWNRHVLNYLAAQKDQDAVKSAMKARRARERQDSEKAERIMRDTASRNRLARSASPKSRPRTSQTLEFPYVGDSGVGGADDGSSASSRNFGSAHGNRPGSSIGNRLAQTHEHSDLHDGSSSSPNKLVARGSAFSTEDAIKKALADPSSVKESSLRLEPVPDPTSKRFEHWARMRFGVLM
jgi:hypothetical protein